MNNNDPILIEKRKGRKTHMSTPKRHRVFAQQPLVQRGYQTATAMISHHLSVGLTVSLARDVSAEKLPGLLLSVSGATGLTSPIVSGRPTAPAPKSGSANRGLPSAVAWPAISASSVATDGAT
jgi:hypothetical protein